jgi:hypothetical protein
MNIGEEARPMAKKYIDPDKIDFRLPCGIDESGEVLLPLSAVRAAIAQTPGEDVVEVVKCRDCVYFRADESICMKHFSRMYGAGFCSLGERKEQA